MAAVAVAGAGAGEDMAGNAKAVPERAACVTTHATQSEETI
jgi:hypothetical protein